VPPSFPKHDTRVQVQVVQAGSATQRHNELVTAQPALHQFAFLQATVGDVEGTQPWAVQMEARAKWDAWNSVKGMAKEEAMKQYIDIVTKGDANWRVSCLCLTWKFKMPQIHALTRLLLIATKISERIKSQLVVVLLLLAGLCASRKQVAPLGTFVLARYY
jgi:acyl-CoA-binding protein